MQALARLQRGTLDTCIAGPDDMKPPGLVSIFLNPYPQRTLFLKAFWAQKPYFTRLLGYFDAKGAGCMGLAVLQGL